MAFTDTNLIDFINDIIKYNDIDGILDKCETLSDDSN
jgi:hypothetical protein